MSFAERFILGSECSWLVHDKVRMLGMKLQAASHKRGTDSHSHNLGNSDQVNIDVKSEV